MAYVGEKVRVISRIKNYDGDPITGGDGVDVTVIVKDSARDAVVPETAMAWDADGNEDGPYWFYDWDSEGQEHGTFQSKVTATGGASGIRAWEYGKIRLEREK